MRMRMNGTTVTVGLERYANSHDATTPGVGLYIVLPNGGIVWLARLCEDGTLGLYAGPSGPVRTAMEDPNSLVAREDCISVRLLD